jgi:hypothetical protein
MLVARGLVEDDIRAETTRVPSGRRQMHEPRRRNESRLLLGTPNWMRACASRQGRGKSADKPDELALGRHRVAAAAAAL